MLVVACVGDDVKVGAGSRVSICLDQMVLSMLKLDRVVLSALPFVTGVGGR
jgi:hypothetical protein